MNNSQIEIYQVENGTTEISVRLENNSVWLNLNQISDLFQRDKSVISRHINNIFNEKELGKLSTVAKFATVQNEGGREIERNITTVPSLLVERGKVRFIGLGVSHNLKKNYQKHHSFYF